MNIQLYTKNKSLVNWGNNIKPNKRHGTSPRQTQVNINNLSPHDRNRIILLQRISQGYLICDKPRTKFQQFKDYAKKEPGKVIALSLLISFLLFMLYFTRRDIAEWLNKIGQEHERLMKKNPWLLFEEMEACNPSY